jgi:hypothetical protein
MIQDVFGWYLISPNRGLIVINEVLSVVDQIERSVSRSIFVTYKFVNLSNHRYHSDLILTRKLDLISIFLGV